MALTSYLYVPFSAVPHSFCSFLLCCFLPFLKYVIARYHNLEWQAQLCPVMSASELSRTCCPKHSAALASLYKGCLLSNSLLAPYILNTLFWVANHTTKCTRDAHSFLSNKQSQRSPTLLSLQDSTGKMWNSSYIYSIHPWETVIQNRKVLKFIPFNQVYRNSYFL